MSTGLFNTARTGANLKSRKFRGRGDAIARFAEELARHDLKSGDKGGSVTLASGRCGVSTSNGHKMLRRIKRELGPQAT